MSTEDALGIDPKTTALVLVDFQRGVVEGMGGAAELGPHTAEDAVGRARRTATTLRELGGLVVVVRGSMGLTGVPFPAPRTDAGVPAGVPVPPHWAEIHPELTDCADHVVTKHQWGSFYGTELEVLLRRNGVTTLLLAGIATNLGVESAAREAYDRGFEQVLIEDATTAFDAAAHHDSVSRVMPLLGRVRNTEQVLAAFARR
ncbi:isochorismatase family protein [Streptomyces sp. NPDC058457]|uniref:isochorismatase family protein n=1 Tax=Streptomyces sp. NPDC058457 TaxID=3346507 RepID=UPI003652B3CE